MPVLPLINQHAGPLPISITFKSPTDGLALIEVSGSVWSGTANVLTGIQVLIDGTVVGTAQIFSNNPSVHRAVVPILVKAPADFNQHKLTLQVANSNTVSDLNDFYTAVLAY
jgi:hypothetical protein